MSAQSDEALDWVKALFQKADDELASAKHRISQLERDAEDRERELALALSEIERLKGERG